MNKKIEERFEFVLTINGNIICQRYFHVVNYNPEVAYSTELKTLMDNLTGTNLKTASGLGTIPSQLKSSSVDYLWSLYNPYFEQTQENVNTGKNNYAKEDVFDLQIKVDTEIIAQSRFSGNIFPQNVRYKVNIKEIIPVITSEIRYFLSLKNYTHEYAGVQL